MPHDDERTYQLAIELARASRDEGNAPGEWTVHDAIQAIGHVVRALSEEAGLSGAEIDEGLRAAHNTLEGLDPPAGIKNTPWS
jgi:hypothetical protein